MNAERSMAVKTSEQLPNSFRRRRIKCITEVITLVLFTGVLDCVSLDAQQGSDRQDLRQVYQQYHETSVKGDYTKAVEILTESFKTHPDREVTNIQLRGELYFMNAQIKEAVNDFDFYNKRQPSSAPQNWQRGLALYYAKEFKKGVEQFELHQKVNPNDVENAVWHFLCMTKWKGVKEARKNLIAIEGDSRVPMKEIHDLFSGAGTVEQVFEAAKDGRPEIRAAHNYYANVYVGLYFDALGENKKAAEYMKRAADNSPFPKNVLMGQVARVHQVVRGREKKKANEK